MWYLIVNDDTGALVSETSEDPVSLNPPLIYLEYESRPDFRTKVWNTTTRELEDRPVVIKVSRLDDYEGWFQNQPEFAIFWPQLNANGKQALRDCVRRGVEKLIGTGNVYRDPSEPWDAGDDIR